MVVLAEQHDREPSNGAAWLLMAVTTRARTTHPGLIHLSSFSRQACKAMRKKLSTEAATKPLMTSIISAFADAVADEDFEAAQGWFSLARSQAQREAPCRDLDDPDA